MAGTTSGASITEWYRRAQLTLRAKFLRELLRLMPMLDPARLEDTTPVWVDMLMGQILAYRAQAAQKAADYYDRFRSAEIGAEPLDRARLVGLDAVPHEAIRTSLLVTGPYLIRWHTSRGMDPREAAAIALVTVAGSASRHVRNGGREVVTNAINMDELATGYARVTSGHPCSFCAMLASRGPEYKTRASAQAATERAKHREAGERYHDHCMCGVEPTFTHDAPWPGQAREYAQLWADSTTGVGGKKAQAAFRRAYRDKYGDRPVKPPLSRT
jgi:hypothetical protein